jgi:hypothetical protein
MARKVIVDDEAPEIAAEMFARMRPMKDVTPGMAVAIKALRALYRCVRHNCSCHWILKVN